MRRTRVSVLIEKDLDRKIEHLAIDLNKTKSELYELGARILVELVETGRVSEDTLAEVEELRKLAKDELAAVGVVA